MLLHLPRSSLKHLQRLSCANNFQQIAIPWDKSHQERLTMLREDSRKGSELETKFISSMRTLQSSLQLFGQSGSTAEFEQIAAEIRFLEKHSLASNFVQTAKRVLSHPNLEICLPSHFIERKHQCVVIIGVVIIGVVIIRETLLGYPWKDKDQCRNQPVFTHGIITSLQ